MKKIANLVANNNKSAVLLDQAIFSGNNFLSTFLLARILGISDFGIYASIILFIYLIISVLNALIIQPLQVSIAGIEDKNAYISFNFWLQAGFSSIILLGILGGFSLNIPVISDYNQIQWGIMMLTTGFIFHDFFRKLFLARVQILNTLMIDILISSFQFSLLVVGLFLIDFSLSNILLYLGLSYLPSVLLGIYLIKPKWYALSKWKSYFILHLHQAKWLVMTAVVQWWSSNLFVVASGIFLGLEALGAFRLVQSLFGVLNILLQSFENYSLPQAARLLVNSQDEAKTYIKQIGIKSAIPFISILLIIFIFANPIITLAGGVKYASYDYVVKGMAILYVFIFIGYPIRMAIRALILNKNFFFGYVLSLIFSLLSFNFIIERWSLVGVIGGLIASQIIVLSYWQFILHKNNFSLWK